MDINKEEMLEQLMGYITLDIEESTGTYKAARVRAAEGESAMQSRYDTMRIEGSWVSDGLGQRIQELENEVEKLLRIDVKTKREKVYLGSLVELEDEGESKSYFFILPGGGGRSLESGDTNIKVITQNAPFAKAMIGKEVYDEVTFRIKGKEKTYEITDMK